MSLAADAMVNAMIACIGAHETNGDNVNFITSWYGEDGQPWCDMTVSYAAYHSNNVQPVCFGFKHDYTVEHAQTFANHGQWHTDVAGIQRGDIVFFDWNGTDNISAIDHVGVVESVDLAGVHTIEGNIDNVCKRMVRHSDFIAGYGRPAYAPDPVPPPPPPVPTPVPNPTPTPVPPPLPVVSCALVRSASSGGPAAPTAVANVQNALAKLGYIHFTNRGEWGYLTTGAYSSFQKSLGYSGVDASGHPGITSLTALAKKSGLFTAAP